MAKVRRAKLFGALRRNDDRQIVVAAIGRKLGPCLHLIRLKRHSQCVCRIKSYISIALTLIWILIFATFSLSRFNGVGNGMVGERWQVHSKLFDDTNNNNKIIFGRIVHTHTHTFTSIKHYPHLLATRQGDSGTFINPLMLNLNESKMWRN